MGIEMGGEEEKDGERNGWVTAKLRIQIVYMIFEIIDLTTNFLHSWDYILPGTCTNMLLILYLIYLHKQRRSRKLCG